MKATFITGEKHIKSDRVLENIDKQLGPRDPWELTELVAKTKSTGQE